MAAKGPIRFNTEDRNNSKWIFPLMGVLMFSTVDMAKDTYCFTLHLTASAITELHATYDTAEQRDRKLEELLVLVGVNQPDFDVPKIVE